MKLPIKINRREKHFLLIGGVAIVVIVLFELFSQYSVFMKNAQQVSDAKLLTLEKQLNRILSGDDLRKQADKIRQEVKKQKSTLLRGNKPPVAAAELQRILKEMTISLKIDVKMERALNPVDIDFYLGIPVEIGFTATTGKLKDILYKIRKSRFLLTVSEMKVNVKNISKPEDIYTTLKVIGFIPNPAKDALKKGIKDVS